MKQGIQIHYFSPIWEGVVCFFERGACIFKNLGAYTLKKLELVLQGQ